MSGSGSHLVGISSRRKIELAVVVNIISGEYRVVILGFISKVCSARRTRNSLERKRPVYLDEGRVSGDINNYKRQCGEYK